MTSSIYSSMSSTQIQTEKKDYQQNTSDSQSSSTNISINLINNNQISSSMNQESIDLLTASTKFVPSSLSSSSGLHNNLSSSSSGKHNHLNNLDMDDIDSNDDMYDDDLMDCENNQSNKNYKMNSGGSGNSSLNINGSNQMSNNIPNMTEDDKRKRRAIANSNERRRMQSINAGFQTLKTLIPHSSGEKLSKACILQRSADYMNYLSDEKEKITNKFQIAIKLIEQNGLLAQLQTQINQSLSNSGTLSTTVASSKSNKTHKQCNIDTNTTYQTSCSSQNTETTSSSSQSNNSAQKIINISQTTITSTPSQPVLIASNRKSLTNLSPSIDDTNTTIKFEQPINITSSELPIPITLSENSTTISNPLTSIINITNNETKLNTSPSSNKTHHISKINFDNDQNQKIPNNNNNDNIIKNQLSNEDNSSSLLVNTILDVNTSTNSIKTSASNITCRQLSDTTNIISLENNNLILLNNNNAISVQPSLGVITTNVNTTTNQLQLITSDSTPSSSALITSTDLKNSNNFFNSSPTVIQTFNSIGSLTNLPTSQQNSSLNTKNSEYENSKKISNLLRFSDSNSIITTPNKKQIKSVNQEPLTPPSQANDNEIQNNNQQLFQQQHIQIPNTDLIKLIEVKVNSNLDSNNIDKSNNDFLQKIMENIKSSQTLSTVLEIPTSHSVQLVNKIDDSSTILLNDELSLAKNTNLKEIEHEINNNKSKIIHTNNKKTLNKISKLNEQNENFSHDSDTNENCVRDTLQLSNVSYSSPNTIKNLTSMPSLTSTKSNTSNKIRHINQIDTKNNKIISALTPLASLSSSPSSQTKNINQYISSINSNSQTNKSHTPPHVSSILGKSYLVKSSRSNSIDQLIAAAKVASSPNISTTNNEINITSPDDQPSKSQNQSVYMTPISPTSSSSNVPSPLQNIEVITNYSCSSTNPIESTIKDESLNKEKSEKNCSTKIDTYEVNLIESLNVMPNKISNELSVSRKSLNNLVEAIFHVEGNLYELDEEQSKQIPLNDEYSDKHKNSSLSALSDTLLTPMMASSSYDATSSSSSPSLSVPTITHSNSNQNQQLHKPPKKRKYTTEDITQMFPTNTESTEQYSHNLINNNQFISDYYKNQKITATSVSYVANPITINKQDDQDNTDKTKPTLCYIDITHFLKNNPTTTDLPILITSTTNANIIKTNTINNNNNNNNINANNGNTNSNANDDNRKNNNGEALISLLVSSS